MHIPYHGLAYTESAPSFTTLRQMAENWIAVQKISTDIQFNTIVMILGKEGHNWYESLSLLRKNIRTPRSTNGPKRRKTGKLTYALLLGRAWLHKRLKAKYTEY